jgi:hypothetical protein
LNAGALLLAGVDVVGAFAGVGLAAELEQLASAAAASAAALAAANRLMAPVDVTNV